jgi:hypothetical protein
MVVGIVELLGAGGVVLGLFMAFFRVFREVVNGHAFFI